MQDLIHLCLKDFGQCLSDPRLSGLDSLITIIFVVIPVIGGLVNKLMNINFWKFVLVTGTLFLLYGAIQREEYLLVTNEPDIQTGQYTSGSDKYFNLHWRPACPNSSDPVVELLEKREDECTKSPIQILTIEELTSELRKIGLLEANESINPITHSANKPNESIVIYNKDNVPVGFINVGRLPEDEVGSVWRQKYSEKTQVSNKCRLTGEYKWKCFSSLP